MDKSDKLTKLNLTLAKHEAGDLQYRKASIPISPALLVSSTRSKQSAAFQNKAPNGNNIKKIVVDYVSPTNQSYKSKPF